MSSSKEEKSRKYHIAILAELDFLHAVNDVLEDEEV